MILNLHKSHTEFSLTPNFNTLSLGIESKLKELPLYDFQIECSCLGKEVADELETNPLLPGVILVQNRQFAGMISRRRFLEQMSSPYGLELFYKRPLHALYRFANADILQLTGDVQVMEAANLSLQRSAELVYEPIVVEIGTKIYKLLDMHHLLLAHSHIHKLTSQLLNEQMNEKTKALNRQIEQMSTMGKQEKIASARNILASVAYDLENPNSYVDDWQSLFIYYQYVKEVMSSCSLGIPQGISIIDKLQETYELDFIIRDLPEILKTMKIKSERLTKVVLKQVLAWIGDQPFLTQKLYKLLGSCSSPIPINSEAEWIENLVRSQVIKNWESQDEPEHWRTIRNRLINSEQNTARLL